MRFEALVEMLGAQGWFDLQSVVQLSGGRRETIRVQLHRWCASGRLVPLRRGMYAFPARRGGPALNPASMANALYAPSYLSTHWALGFYGLIPERVVEFTSVTSRVPREFRNAFGVFSYRHVKAGAFFGYRAVEIDGGRVLIALPEKALLDLFHLEKGGWTSDRMREMRFGGFESADRKTLNEWAGRFESPRVAAAAAEWCRIADSETEGTVEL